MRPLAHLAPLALAACAGFSGHGLAPGQSTEEQVEALMGPAAAVRKASGDEVRYYSRQPYGRQIYAARIGPDHKLVSLEPRLTDQNVAKLRPGVLRDEDVRDLLGPPYRVEQFPRLQREAWTYKMLSGGMTEKDLYVQFSPDRVLREVMMIDDPEYSAHDTVK